MALSLALLLALPAAALPRGIYAVSDAEVRRYELSEGRLVLAAKGPGRDADDVAVCGSALFGVRPLGRTVYRLDAGLAEDRTTGVGEVREVLRMLGCADGFLYVFFDNTVAAFDTDLKPAGRLRLAPRRAGGIEPSLAPRGFLAYAGTGYLLAPDAGQAFAFDLALSTASRLPLDDAGTLRGMWIDPRAGTLDVLDETRLDGLRQDKTRTFLLGEPGRAPEVTLLFEEAWREEPPALAPQGDDGPRVYERIPPARRLVRMSGVDVGRMEPGVPTVAEVTVTEGPEGAQSTRRRRVVLRRAGAYEDAPPAPRRPELAEPGLTALEY